MPSASSGCGQGGYKFAMKICKPSDSTFKALSKLSASNPKLSDMPFSSSHVTSLLFLQNSDESSLHQHQQNVNEFRSPN